ncbi:unnamed protein product [Rotaria magnacalcarata]|uniref:Uncharacterized protein n=2 Tax=Rotaria magnacalcarata TaxID=392030 RepID=A0A819U5C6_9BILA|nr:unnamed protein product [Rotaria magnacalcarata]
MKNSRFAHVTITPRSEIAEHSNNTQAHIIVHPSVIEKHSNLPEILFSKTSLLSSNHQKHIISEPISSVISKDTELSPQSNHHYLRIAATTMTTTTTTTTTSSTTTTTTCQSLLDFDTIGTSYTSVPNGYGCFQWSGGTVLQYLAFGTMSGYNTAVSSVPYVIYTSTTLTMSTVNATFTMNSFMAASAWNDNLNVSISGLLHGVTMQATSLLLQVFTKTNITLNWPGIDTMTLTTGGGTHNTNVSGTGEFVAIDNMLVAH